MEDRKTLNKTLKAHWVWAIALGSAIGWGAFVQPTNWLETAGPLGVIIGFSIGAVLMMLIAVSYGFLIQSFPVSGGEFAYAYLSMGRTHAFIGGWFLTLGYICIVALNSSAFSLMIKYVFPYVIENVLLYTIAGWEVYLIEILIAVLGLIIFGYLNVKGTGISGKIQFVFAMIMVVTVIILTILVAFKSPAPLTNIQPYFPSGTTSFAAIIAIVAIAPWAFVGFDAVPQAAEEFDFPAKKAFMLIIMALIFATIIYSLMILATAMAAPWQDTTAKQHLWGTGVIIQQLLGAGGLAILVVALSMGIFTGLNGFIMTSSRLLFAMARAQILPQAFQKLHKKHDTPYVAIIFTVIVAGLAPWFGREALTWVVDMSSIGVSIAYFYTCITAFKLFKWNNDSINDPSIEAVAPVKKIISFIGMIVSLIFVGLLLVPTSPAFMGKESLIALLIWTGLGVIFYLFKRKKYLAIPKEKLDYLILDKK